MEPLRHSLVAFALAAAAVLGAPAGAAYASLGCAELRDPPPGAEPAPDALALEPIPAALPAGERPAPARARLAATPGAGPAGPPEPATAAPGPAPPHRGARKLELDLPLELEVHGRVLMDLGADERDGWARSLGMSSARLGLEARLPGVKTVLQADLAEDPIVQDAYVRLDGPGATRLTAGRFKAPFSERRLASAWRLPLVDRGLVDHYLVKRNGLGGRRLGVAATLRPWDGRLDATAGVFAGDPQALDAGSDTGEDWAARVAVRRGEALELGVGGYRAGPGSGPDAAPARHAGSVFANLDLGPLEAALEGFAGRIAQGPFAAGTALVGWKLRARSLHVTPVAGGEALEVRGAGGGVGYGAIAGAVLSWTEGLKVKLQGEWARRPGDESPASAVAVEVGTAF